MYVCMCIYIYTYLYEIRRGLHEADLHVAPQNICHAGAVIVGVGGEIMVLNLS